MGSLPGRDVPAHTSTATVVHAATDGGTAPVEHPLSAMTFAGRPRPVTWATSAGRTSRRDHESPLSWVTGEEPDVTVTPAPAHPRAGNWASPLDSATGPLWRLPESSLPRGGGAKHWSAGEEQPGFTEFDKGQGRWGRPMGDMLLSRRGEGHA